MSRRHSDEDATTLVVAAIILAVLLLAVFLVIATIVEIGRIYTERTRPGSPIARSLWMALTALLALWLFTGLVASTSPDLVAAAAYLAAWGFLAFVAVVTVLEYRMRQHDDIALAETGKLGTYLEPFSPPSGTLPDRLPAQVPVPNGHPPMPEPIL